MTPFPTEEDSKSRYTLLSDHWLPGYARPRLGEPWPGPATHHRYTYRGGVHAGTSFRPEYVATLPTFPTHEEALRHFLEQPMASPLLARPGLTPADITDLRISTRERIPDILAEGAILPSVRYNATQDRYELVLNSIVLCTTAKGEVALALIRAERFEPGYISRALDARYTPEEAAADADARERSRRQRAGWEASERARKLAEEEEARARRVRSAPTKDAPGTLTIDDLFDTL